MPVGYLTFTGLVALGTWFALFPTRRLATVSYWFGLVLNELPFLAFTLLLASTLLAFGQGDIDSPAGWAVVGLAAATSVGLGVVALRAKPTRDLPWAGILLAPLWVRRGDVRRIANLSYGPAGKRNLLDVYRRRDRPSGGPVLVYAHGGRFRGGRKNREARLLLYRLASQGWVCLSINYRLQPRASFPDFHEDYAKAIGWAREHAGEHGGDSATLFVSGSSAGAHLAAMAALTDTAVAGALCFYGYYGRVDGTPESTPVTISGRTRHRSSSLTATTTRSCPSDGRATSSRHWRAPRVPRSTTSSSPGHSTPSTSSTLSATSSSSGRRSTSPSGPALVGPNESASAPRAAACQAPSTSEIGRASRRTPPSARRCESEPVDKVGDDEPLGHLRPAA